MTQPQANDVWIEQGRHLAQRWASVSEGAMRVGQVADHLGAVGPAEAVWTLEGKADTLSKQYFTPVYVVDKSNADTFLFEGVSRPPANWTMPK